MHDDIPLMEGIWGGFPAKQKVLTFPFCWISPQQKTESPCPLITDHILEKMVSLIAFRQTLSKILPEACIFSNKFITYLKKLVGIISLITKQCPARLSPKFIPHYPLKHLREIKGMGKKPTQQPNIY